MRPLLVGILVVVIVMFIINITLFTRTAKKFLIAHQDACVLLLIANILVAAFGWTGTMALSWHLTSNPLATAVGAMVGVGVGALGATLAEDCYDYQA